MEKTKKTGKEKTNDRKSKIITAAVVTFLCIVFVAGFIYGLNSVLAMEGAYPPEEDTRGIIKEEPKTNKEIADLLTEAFEYAAENKPKATIEDEFAISEDSIVVDGSDELKKTVLFAREGFTNALAESTENTETDYSADVPVKAPQITQEDIESFECQYFARNYVYQCEACEAESDELLDGCPECGSPNLYVQQIRGEYAVSVVLKNSDTVLNANFPQRTDEEIRSMLGDSFSKTLDINSIDITNDNIEVFFRINRETKELTYLEFKKDMTVKTDVKFIDKFASLGSTHAEFMLTEKNKNTFTWPSIVLSEEEMVIEPKKTDNLTATLTCADPTKPKVTWKSSDESVVTVDDEGYMKAGKEPGEATITASFEFNGKTYTDTCKISVKIPVESMSISKRHLKLDVGETKQLEAKVSPKKATYQGKKWYSEDESIATVDEKTGVVTAVKSGVVTIYALSEDGFFRSSCEVTVK